MQGTSDESEGVHMRLAAMLRAKDPLVCPRCGTLAQHGQRRCAGCSGELPQEGLPRRSQWYRDYMVTRARERAEARPPEHPVVAYLEERRERRLRLALRAAFVVALLIGLVIAWRLFEHLTGLNAATTVQFGPQTVQTVTHAVPILP